MNRAVIIFTCGGGGIGYLLSKLAARKVSVSKYVLIGALVGLVIGEGINNMFEHIA